MSTEKWKVIPGFSDYWISSHGRIFSLTRLDLLKLSKTQDGYFRVVLRNGIGKSFKVHRLVLYLTKILRINYQWITSIIVETITGLKIFDGLHIKKMAEIE